MAFREVPMYFEEFEVGDVCRMNGRTITEADIVNFAGMTGDFNPLHMDKVYAAKNMHKERIAHGALVLSIATGMFNASNYVNGTTIAFLGLTADYTKAVKIGDTLTFEVTVASKRETSKPDKGIVYFNVSMKNQNGEEVLTGEWKFMMKTRQFKESE